jgi:hypothetical protein
VKILRTIIWVLALIGFLVFALYNWKPVEVTLWENLVLETKLPVLAVLAFALGFVPLWAYHLSVTWGLNRRVRTLENSLKTAALARHHETHGATSVPADNRVDTPVDKAGTGAAEPADPLSPAPEGGAA